MASGVQPQFQYTQPPSKVLHLRNLPWECTPEELVELGSRSARSSVPSVASVPTAIGHSSSNSSVPPAFPPAYVRQPDSSVCCKFQSDLERNARLLKKTSFPLCGSLLIMVVALHGSKATHCTRPQRGLLNNSRNSLKTWKYRNLKSWFTILFWLRCTDIKLVIT
uniref:Polypyrimidine tract-binding protein 2-like protein isoform X3 n=1 Tax=Saccharum officinarum TaxID=4547 RepID=A0A678T6E7_SACOF|nr:polypyrimidine tract-binding protein 2-like protein isoform X3 [Saccharum officinarum]